MIRSLDHVNIRTNALEAMTSFYQRVLELTVGPRPDFSFAGAWLYCGDQAAIHLVGTDEPLHNERVQLEHFAFMAVHFHATRDRLLEQAIPHRVTPVPGYDQTQIHLADPDGNHIELNFDGRWT